MALRQPKKLPTPADRALEDRIARARRANPPRDPTGVHHEALAELAHRFDRDVVDLVDLWDERAAIREYDGAERRAAERLAVEDVRDLVDPQRRLV